MFYMMKENPEVFARLGRTWDGDEKSYCHVMNRVLINVL